MDENFSLGLGIFENSLLGCVLGLGLKDWAVGVEMRALRWLNVEWKSVRVCEV